jgi:peptidoglycan/xylan/chitin deacetylase (PgdA/CDA1 family)
VTGHNKRHILLIVCYHYFRETSYRGGIYPINKTILERQIAAIGRDYRFVGESDILRWFREGAPDGKYCLITFDDGLKEQITAYRLLKAKAIPSMCYVPSGHYQNKQVLEVHKLHYIRTQINDEAFASELNALSAWREASFDEKVLTAQYPFDSVEGRRIKYFFNFMLSAAEKGELVQYLFDQLVNNQELFFNSLYLSTEEIKELAEGQALGAHGKSHMPLSRFSGDELRHEISDNANYLEAVAQQPIRSFAYPYGGKTAVNEDTWRGFEDSSIEFALTTWHGTNDASEYSGSNRFYLKRVDTNYAPGGKCDVGEV